MTLNAEEFAPNTVQPERREELGVLFGEEILKELVKEKVVFLLSQHLFHRLSHIVLVTWVASNLRDYQYECSKTCPLSSVAYNWNDNNKSSHVPYKGKEVVCSQFSMLRCPPNPAPRSKTGFPSAPTILVPSIFSTPRGDGAGAAGTLMSRDIANLNVKRAIRGLEVARVRSHDEHTWLYAPSAYPKRTSDRVK